MKTKILAISMGIMLLLTGCGTGSKVENKIEQSTVEVKEGELLPLGTVVLLEGGEKKIMICGRGQRNVSNGKSEIYDYSAVYYPQGYLKADEIFLFNHDAIDEVFFVGFEDEEELEFKKYATEQLKKIRSNE